MPITVGVLGAFSVSGHGGTVDLPGRRQRSVTAILALEGGRVVSAARLIDLLWPDTEPADPLNALQHQISSAPDLPAPGGDGPRRPWSAGERRRRHGPSAPVSAAGGDQSSST